MKDSVEFLVEFIRNQKRVGAIAPSSEHLAREMVFDLDLESADLVVEYGPGTGAFTGEVADRIPDEAEYLAFEQNARFAGKLRDRFDRVEILECSVAEAPEVLRQRGHGVGSVDAIVSGLPWAAFERSLQQELLDATLEILAPGGRFATFAYIHGLVLPTARRFRESLEERFVDVTTSRIVWRNLPPALVYRCSAPTEKTSAAFR